MLRRFQKRDLSGLAFGVPRSVSSHSIYPQAHPGLYLTLLGYLMTGRGNSGQTLSHHMPNQNTFTWITSSFPELSNIQTLGQGGQKLVFSGQHASEGNVVLKIIHPYQDPEGVRREILAVQQIATIRLPRILAVGRVDTPIGSCIWIREQRIVGQTLRERLQAGPLSIDELFTFGTQVLEALADAEKANIVHRDVKPENIMMDTKGDYWLLDFGISRHLTMTPITPASHAFGKFTPGYAPPEQFRNIQNEIDSRADLF